MYRWRWFSQLTKWRNDQFLNYFNYALQKKMEREKKYKGREEGSKKVDDMKN